VLFVHYMLADNKYANCYTNRTHSFDTN